MNFKKLIAILNYHQQSRVFLWSWRIALACCLLTIVVLIAVWSKLPPLVPFFYSLPWGEDQLTSPLTLIFFLLLVFGFYVINMFLSALLNNFSRVFAKILLISATFFCLLATITVIKILFLLV